MKECEVSRVSVCFSDFDKQASVCVAYGWLVAAVLAGLAVLFIHWLLPERGKAKGTSVYAVY